MTVSDLPEQAGAAFLWCESCGGEYSATRGDYFWMSAADEFTCCDEDLQLATKHTHYRVVA